MNECSLAEIIEEHGGLIQTGPFGSQLHQHEYTEQGVPVVMPKDIKGGRVDRSTVARISEQKAAELSRHALPRESIVFPRRGDIGKCALVSAEEEGFLCGTGCIKIEIPEKVLIPQFLFYHLNTQQTIEWLERNAVGTTMLNLNTKILGRLPIPRLDLITQKAIADILSAYDDLIENNRRRMVLLEESARLLYREWFVYLRFPGHEHANIIAGVPEGWKKATLSQFIESEEISLQTGPFGTQLRAADYTETGIPVINVRNIGYGSIRHEKLEFLPEMKAESLAMHRLVSGDIVFGRKGAVDRHVLVGPNEKGWMQGSDCIRLRVEKGDRLSPVLLSIAFREEAHKKWMLGQCGNKATMASLNQDVIARIPVVVPSNEIHQMFVDLAEDILRQNAILGREADAAAEARDTLLPRIMNGEITV